jgi:predicted ArsR family transcriptional regulator
VKGPTDRQSEVVAAIATLTRQLRRAPSAQEIAAHMGMTREGLRVHLRALEAKGLAHDEPREVRSGKWRLGAPKRPPEPVE